MNIPPIAHLAPAERENIWNFSVLMTELNNRTQFACVVSNCKQILFSRRIIVFKLLRHLLLSEALPSVALQLESGLVTEDGVLKLLLLVYALCTPYSLLLLVGIWNSLTRPHRRNVQPTSLQRF